MSPTPQADRLAPAAGQEPPGGADGVTKEARDAELQPAGRQGWARHQTGGW